MNSEAKKLEPGSAFTYLQDYLNAQRWDATGFAIRLTTLALVFGLMARAIVVHNVSAPFLLVPVAIEILLINWTGLVLARTLVNCPKFRREGYQPGMTLGLTLVMLLITLLIAAWQPSGSFSLAGARADWLAGAQELWRSGLVLAIAIEAAGLWAATLPDLRRWREVGGEFVWLATFDHGNRFLATLLLLIPLPVVGTLAYDALAPWRDHPALPAWVTFAALLAIELGAIAINYGLYRLSRWYQQRSGAADAPI